MLVLNISTVLKLLSQVIYWSLLCPNNLILEVFKFLIILSKDLMLVTFNLYALVSSLYTLVVKCKTKINCFYEIPMRSVGGATN
jgi:hypothetical protein